MRTPTPEAHLSKYVVSAFGTDGLLFTVDVVADSKEQAEEYAEYKTDCCVPNYVDLVKEYVAHLEVIE